MFTYITTLKMKIIFKIHQPKIIQRKIIQIINRYISTYNKHKRNKT